MYQYISVSLFLFSFGDSINTDQKKKKNFGVYFIFYVT